MEVATLVPSLNWPRFSLAGGSQAAHSLARRLSPLSHGSYSSTN